MITEVTEARDTTSKQEFYFHFQGTNVVSITRRMSRCAEIFFEY